MMMIQGGGIVGAAAGGVSTAEGRRAGRLEGSARGLLSAAGQHGS